MALLADDTKEVTIDNETHQVGDLPEKAKHLVRFYDDWKQRELDARSELLMIQTAMRGLANEIVVSINEAKESTEVAKDDSEPTNIEQIS